MTNGSSKLSGTALASTLVAAGLLLGSGVAWAEIPCLDEINQIRVVLNGVGSDGEALTEGCDDHEISGPRRDPDQTCDSLNSKLNGAAGKLSVGKFRDAEQKLLQFQSKIGDLFDQGKIEEELHDGLLEPEGGVVQDAIDCVRAEGGF